MSKIFLLVGLLFISACGIDNEEQNNTNDAKNLLDEVLTIMEQNSINKNTIDWEDFRERVYAEAGEDPMLADTYNAIKLALELLGDNHSFYLTFTGNVLRGTDESLCLTEQVEEVSVPEEIGYIRVGSFSNSDQSAIDTHANELQDKIEDQDSDDKVGWIVDLRQNLGGNMWPMLAGIGPILGEGAAGYFIDADDNETQWGYTAGVSWSNQSPIVEVNDTYALINTDPRVAVLLDNGVASSGEAIAIAFIGREETRSFGKATCGLSTANRGFSFSDNSSLFLTTAYMADRTKMKYGIPIEPDVISNDADIIQNAVDYLME